MKITVPLYVEEQPPTLAGMTHVRPLLVRPLFFNGLRERDESLPRASARLARALRAELSRLARQGRHEELAVCAFYPPLEEHLLKLTLEINNRRFQVRYLFVMLHAFDRRLAWTPSVPEVWFEVGRGETLLDRASETLTEHYRRLARQHADEAPTPDMTSLAGKAWLSSAEVQVDVPVVHQPPVPSFFALLGASEVLDGAAELERVGRSLGALYPDQLQQAVHRAAEVAETTALLHAADRRPVLLVGRRLVGKTTIIHECVRRRIERRRLPKAMRGDGGDGGDSSGDVWLIAPQRLISGMSYVGQWEGRLLAILKEAQKKRHTLYFDDLIGLFYAGQSSNSSLNVAQVLKPYVERREVRVLAEITPEALRVLQELDRSFADLFHVVPVDEPRDTQNWQTLLAYSRELEREHQARFDYDVLPVVLDLTRRYVSDAAFPGKAAKLLRTLAAKHKAAEVTRADALREFAAQSGLGVDFLDDRAALDRAEVIGALNREVTGQHLAVAACADAVMIAKARLNDTARPLASFLFLGPTGVGKTQCAKALTQYLFGDAERLLRFDMNEFASAYAVARLTGTFGAPEGLLTGAVRRAPFAVVLFDEIEKAHPAVFDLLLGVMGDARLTDARGRTVDFTNTIIILTSNLGVREAGSELGFRQTNQSDAATYRQAAEKFFKPEFFNRLTRVVPFERLRREEVGRIARRLLTDVLQRDGLARRGVKLLIAEDALKILIDAGYHPQLGARALKRTLERQITAPLAARLAATAPDQPLIISLRAHRGSIAVEAQHLTLLGENNDATPPPLPLDNPDRLLDRVEDALERVEDAEELWSPGEILVGGGADSATHLNRFLLREQARRVARMCRRADERLARETLTQRTSGAKRQERQPVGRRSPAATKTPPHKRQLAKLPTALNSSLNDGALLTRNLYRFLQDSAAQAVPYGEATADYLQDVLREVALLDVLWLAVARQSKTRVQLTIVALDEAGRGFCARLRDLYRVLFEREFQCRVETPPEKDLRVKSYAPQYAETMFIDGALAGVLAPLEAGTHLFVAADESHVPVIVRVDDGPEDQRETMALPPVVRLYAEPAATLDVRTQLLALGKLSAPELRAFVLSGLALPAELLAPDEFKG